MVYQFYINEDFEIYTNDEILEDAFGHSYRIIKFINHRKRKNKKENYLVVRLQSLEYKSKIFCLPVDLLKDYKKLGIYEE